MKNTFIDLLRQPDDIKLRTDTSPLRFEEETEPKTSDSRLSFVRTGDGMQVVLHPSDEAVSYVRLRFDGDLSQVITVMGDDIERLAADTVVWQAILPHKKMPWYFYTNDGERLNAYGVKTGGNAFAFWLCDRSGITLLLDTRNGANGVRLKEDLMLCEITQRRGNPDESMYSAARSFCRQMCEKPKLPDGPVFGFNNWYWAYGAIDEKTVLGEVEVLGKMTSSLRHRPFMVIDDGWQIIRSKGYNGGPWNACNGNFESMRKTAERIREGGCRPGIWMRPLLTMSYVPSEAIYASPYQKFGTVMDPTHPFSQEKIFSEVSTIAGWGYEMIKHDFSSLDLFDRGFERNLPPHLFDTSVTNAGAAKSLYALIQSAAETGNAMVMGCNTVGHLSAGIHEMQRIGDDTSGRSFEWTRRQGIHSMMRMPQNDAFFRADPDCAAFTPKVDTSLNLDFMEAMAITGAVVLASVTPGHLKPAEEERMADIFGIIDGMDTSECAEILDWTRTSTPAEFLFRGKKYIYDWYRGYHGSRCFLNWLE